MGQDNSRLLYVVFASGGLMLLCRWMLEQETAVHIWSEDRALKKTIVP